MVSDAISEADPVRSLSIAASAPRHLSPEEEAIKAMLPFAIVCALMVASGLGMVRLIRAVRNMRSESIVRRLRETRAAQKKWEERREDERREQERRDGEEQRLQMQLAYACRSFMRAAAALNSYEDVAFEAVHECITLVPELVRARELEPHEAELIERHQELLLIVKGCLRTKQDERAYVDYLAKLDVFDISTGTSPRRKAAAQSFLP